MNAFAKSTSLGMSVILPAVLVLTGCSSDEAEQTSQIAVQTASADISTRITNSYTPSLTPEDEFRQMASPKRAPQEIILKCLPVTGEIHIDGQSDEKIWASAKAITTLDYPSQREITIKSVHDNENIYFLISYADISPSVTHKSYIWNEEEEIYVPGNDREDAFVLKWSMQGNDADLALRNGKAHLADLWFWKACRTNPAGYADDKHQIYQEQPDEKFLAIKLSDSRNMYLKRSGDAGKSAYQESIPVDYAGKYTPRFSNRQPEGSRGDIKAGGKWSNGKWILELARKLDTGHEDDIAFEIGGEYLFGVSCYEMAGREINPSWSQPLYHMGDVYDRIKLSIIADNTK